MRALTLIAALVLALAASAEEPAPPSEPAPEEIVVRGVKTGVLDPIPAASPAVASGSGAPTASTSKPPLGYGVE